MTKINPIHVAIFIAIFSIVVTVPLELEEKIMADAKGKSTKEIFKAFHFIHEKHKEYNLNSEEGLRRYRIFKNSLKFIEEENAKEGKKLFGITQFADLTHEEFKERFTMKPGVLEAQMEEFMNKRFLTENDEEHHDHHHHHHHHHHNDHNDHDDHDDEHDLKEETLPDWRKWDGPVKNQRSCGSCWAFCAMAAVENMYNKLKGEYHNFSEQHIVDCNTENGGCNGGRVTRAYRFMRAGGVVATEEYPYLATQQVCDTKWESREYKIVKNYRRYYREHPDYSSHTWDEMIRKGPIAVTVDASTDRRYMYYRPETFLPFYTKDCVQETHGVTAVALIKEDGKEYIIIRNSWGTKWGYKGYMKWPRLPDSEIPLDNCKQTKSGWQPIVYDGQIPEDNVKPEPEPVVEDCIDLYGNEGFSKDKILTVCDSATNPGYFYGVKFPEKQTTTNPLNIKLFKYYECIGFGSDLKDFISIDQSTEFPQYEGVKTSSGSLAYFKPAKEGCVTFYKNNCLAGSPQFHLCNDVEDSSGVNLEEIKDVNSFVIDTNKIASVAFYPEPNFQGNPVIVNSGDDVYNMSYSSKIRDILRVIGTRSIKFTHKN